MTPNTWLFANLTYPQTLTLGESYGVSNSTQEGTLSSKGFGAFALNPHNWLVTHAAPLTLALSHKPLTLGGVGSYESLAQSLWSGLPDVRFKPISLTPSAENKCTSVQELRAGLARLASAITDTEYLNDWRALKLEREVWRSVDTLGSARRHWLFRQKHYSTFYEPATMINKVST